MTIVIAALGGFLLGGLAVRVLMMRSRRGMRPHELDGQYQAAKRATLRHMRVHGTMNLQQLERMMDINGITAMRYLDQMARDGLLKLQGHRGKGAFYTRA